ncbi:MAG: nucleoside triphosphate pyrophosphohydrolase [Ahrensia sp.]|nr:nucleoside triphosphate pyrophosphohydrolase [Ahrensia sp.]
MQPSRDISRLLEIMAALRDRDTGCPWDVEQTFRTIVPYTIEETYEVVDAIERDDMDDLREELGDLLLQTVFHAQMAREEGAFDFGEVVEAITTKMIRRHPHVFGDEDARTAGMAKGAWDRIKAQEKTERAQRRAKAGLPPKKEDGALLDAVPAAMPPLLEALKLQQKAAKVGFDWNDPQAVIAKLREETAEAETALNNHDRDALEDEIGDLFFTLVNLARHLDIDPGSALRRCNGKFRRRFADVENAFGDKLKEASLDEMEAAWVTAKNSESAG